MGWCYLGERHVWLPRRHWDGFGHGRGHDRDQPGHHEPGEHPRHGEPCYFVFRRDGTMLRSADGTHFTRPEPVVGNTDLARHGGPPPFAHWSRSTPSFGAFADNHEVRGGEQNNRWHVENQLSGHANSSSHESNQARGSRDHGNVSSHIGNSGWRGGSAHPSGNSGATGSSSDSSSGHSYSGGGGHFSSGSHPGGGSGWSHSGGSSSSGGGNSGGAGHGSSGYSGGGSHGGGYSGGGGGHSSGGGGYSGSSGGSSSGGGGGGSSSSGGGGGSSNSQNPSSGGSQGERQR